MSYFLSTTMSSLFEEVLEAIEKIDTDIYDLTKEYIKHCINSVNYRKIVSATNPSKLFVYAFECGLVPVIRYMYEIMNVEYDYRILNECSQTLQSQTPSDTIINSACKTGASNASCRLEIMGRLSAYRVICYNYLQHMKKYSIRTLERKKHMYKFNCKRYEICELIDDYLEAWIYMFQKEDSQIKIKTKNLKEIKTN